MLRIGIIGFGYWGPNLARSFSETDGFRVCAICDLSSEVRARAERRFPMAALTGDPRVLFDDPDLDAVAISTPVHTHYELALAALRAGKHVLVEKPMTETSEQAERLIEEATRRNLVLMVDHTFIYTPAVQKIRALISDGSLGQIYYYDSLRVNLGLFQRDVNVIWDLAVHDFAILNHVLDESPIAVSANGARHVVGSPENMAYISLFFPSGAIAHINVNWLAPVKIRQTLIGGSNRMIVYDDLSSSEKVKIYDKGVVLAKDPEQIYQMRVGYRTGDIHTPQLSTKEALRTEAEHFRTCIEEGVTPLTGGTMGLSVVELLESATLSMHQRGRPIDLVPLRRAS
jgi:predicted dehydrogenase